MDLWKDGVSMLEDPALHDTGILFGFRADIVGQLYAIREEHLNNPNKAFFEECLKTVELIERIDRELSKRGESETLSMSHNDDFFTRKELEEVMKSVVDKIQESLPMDPTMVAIYEECVTASVKKILDERFKASNM